MLTIHSAFSVKGLGVALLIFLGVFLLTSNKGPEEPKTPEEAGARYCGKGGMSNAYTAAREFMRQRLRSPATAKFPDIDELYVDVKYSIDCTFHIKSHMDSKSGFGALVRNSYSMIVQYLPNEWNWQAKDIDIVGQ